MYFGSIVEESLSNNIFVRPKHPYTKLLSSSVPLINKRINYVNEESELPDPSNPPNHCSFYDRCSIKSDICKNEIPKLKGDKSLVRCFNELS